MALTDNLIAHWKLNEASGTRSDSWGSRHLADNNTVGSNTGKLGNAAEFVNANDEFLNVASDSGLQMGDVDFTLAAWVWLDSKPSIMWAAGKFSGSSREYALVYENGTDQYSFLISTDGSDPGQIHTLASTFGNPPTGEWHFLVGWYDSVADTLNVQVNDGGVDSQSHSGGCHVGDAEFAIGGLANGGFGGWDGRIDHVLLYDRVLDSGERTQLYNSGNGYDFLADGHPALRRLWGRRHRPLEMGRRGARIF